MHWKDVLANLKQKRDVRSWEEKRNASEENWLVADLDVWEGHVENVQDLNVKQRKLEKADAERKPEKAAKDFIWEKTEKSVVVDLEKFLKLFQEEDWEKSQENLQEEFAKIPKKMRKRNAKRKTERKSKKEKRSLEKKLWENVNANLKPKKNAKIKNQRDAKEESIVAEENAWEKLAELVLKKQINAPNWQEKSKKNAKRTPEEDAEKFIWTAGGQADLKECQRKYLVNNWEEQSEELQEEDAKIPKIKRNVKTS